MSVSLQSPEIFGQFCHKQTRPLLRILRSIRIRVLLDCEDHLTVKRQRARLDYFVTVFKKYKDNEHQVSCLRNLKIDVVVLKSYGHEPYNDVERSEK